MRCGSNSKRAFAFARRTVVGRVAPCLRARENTDAPSHPGRTPRLAGPNVSVIVVSLGSNDVVFANLATAHAEHRVTVGRSPSRIAVDATNSRAYVANFGIQLISIIDVASATVVGAIATSNGPASMAFDPIRKFLYVCNVIDGRISTIDLATNSTIATAIVGKHPNAIAIDADGKTGYVAPTGHVTVKPVSLDVSASAIAIVATAPRTAYLISESAGQLLIFDRETAKIAKRIEGFSRPSAFRLDATGSRAYVAEAATSTVAIVDLQGGAISARISVGSQPYAIAGDRAGRYLFTADYGDNGLGIVDIARGTSSRILGFNEPLDLAVVR